MSELVKDRSIQLYQSINDANEERVYKHFHASSIAICPRAHYYNRLGVKSVRKPTAAKMIRWGAGHKLEEELREHIDKVWGGTTSNIRLTSEELDLTGEYDNLTKDGTTLIEVKSVHERAFRKVDGEYGLIDAKPYLNHEYQNHAYVLLLAEEHLDVKNIDYVYTTLSGLLCVYHTEVDPKKLEWVRRRLKSLRNAWKTQTLPPCLCLNYDSELYKGVYQYCDYYDHPNGVCCSEELVK